VRRAWPFAAGLLIGSAAIAVAEPLVLEVASAQVAFDTRTNEPIVSFRLTEPAGRRFATFTSANVGRKAEIRVDGRALMAPVIKEPILGGSGQISAGFKLDEAKDLTERLASGRARMEIEAVE